MAASTGRVDHTSLSRACQAYREQETLAIDADRGERLLTQAFGLLRIPGGHELRARPQTRHAQGRGAKRRLQLEASVKMCAGACRIETSEKVSQNLVRLRLDQGIVQASRLGHYSLGISDEPGEDVGVRPAAADRDLRDRRLNSTVAAFCVERSSTRSAR